MTKSIAEAMEHGATTPDTREEQGIPGIWAGRLRRVLASPGRRVQLITLVALLSGMAATGWWLGSKVEERVLMNTVQVNQLYVESMIVPVTEHLRSRPELPPSSIVMIDRILTQTPLGEQITALILWGEHGQIIYSSNHEEVGEVYPMTPELGLSLAGQTTWDVINASEIDASIPADTDQLLLELYSPVRDPLTGRVLAVVEFYQPYDPLARDIAAARREMWLMVGLVTVLLYILMAAFVEWASATIAAQQKELQSQVERLTEVLCQNDQLYERVQRATHSAAATQERALRRISADLHDGPTQYLGAMALHMDRITLYHRERPDASIDPHVSRAQSALTRAVEELRGIAAGLGVPQIEGMTLDGVIAQVVGSHEQLTSSRVAVVVHELPEQASPAIKLTIYRVLQEALSNAYRHGQGAEQKVEVTVEDGLLGLLVSDRGPGFQADAALDGGTHLGLAGMRDRVESLGGHFSVTSMPGRGTWVRALLPLEQVGSHE